MDNLSLGDLIRQKRGAKGWSQAQLAEKIGVETRTIIRWESEETSAPRPYALEKLIRYLDITKEELEEVNRRGKVKKKKAETVSRTIEDQPSAPAEEEKAAEPEPAPPKQPKTPETLIQSAHTERKRRPNWLVLNLTLITIAILATAGIVFWALIGENMFNTISGQVICPDNQQVAGIWIAPTNGGGGTVTLQFQNSSESVAKFTYILPNGGGYDVHAGCGIKPVGGWAKTYRTESCSGPIEDHAFHVLMIYDHLPADRSKPCLMRYGQ